MTFFQHLVLILGLLLAGGSLGRAVDDGADSGSASSSNGSTTGSSTTTTTHHKTHHPKTATAGTNSAPVNPAAATDARRGATGDSTTETAPSKTTSARTSSSAHSAPSAKTSGSPNADESGAATASSTDAATTGSALSSSTHHSHHHTTAAGSGTNSTVAPATSGASTADGSPARTSTHKTPATASDAAAPAGTLTNQAGSAASTTSTTTSSHRRHHATTTAAAKPLPEPPIIVPDTHPSIVPQPPAATATLPTPPPISGTTTPGGSVPTVQTGLPVGRPGTGTTATLPITPFHPAPPPVFNFPFKDYPPERRARTYPWKTSILTTVFWIGEGSTPLSGATNKVSAWDTSWVHNNGGADDQNDMSGYASAVHASTLNPFYIALPFNDLAYPDKTQRWLPDGWYKPTRHGERPVSACKDRWIEIKTRSGRYCFAQWEDVGPIVTDDAEYVFGPERPSAMQGRGLDVSLAVAKYLGIDSTAYTSWRFVDDADVLPGMWLRYDEQALLFRAIKEGLHGSSTPRIQDMEEPTSDPDDSTRKKAGAAGGY